MASNSDSLTDFDLTHSYHGIPFDRSLPGVRTILSCLNDNAQIFGEEPFVTAISANGTPSTLTYAELDELSRRAAFWLKHALQLSAGDIVALLPVNDTPSIISIFALIRLGCRILFLNHADPPQRLRQQVEALEAKTILRVPAVSSELLTGAVQVPEAFAAATSDPDVVINPTADAFYFATSGSTAVSKLVAQCHYNAAVNAHAVVQHHKLKRDDRLLACLPIHHVNCLHFTIFATLVAGAHVILAPAFDPFRYPRLLEQFRPRIASVVPSVLDALTEIWRRPKLPDDFDYFVSAAAPLSARTLRGVSEKLGARVLQGYGLTETVNFSTTMSPALSPETYQRFALGADIPSIGSSLHGNEVAVLNANGDYAAPGEVGEICMRGHNVMLGYAGNEAATAEAFRFGWFHSQDLGYHEKDNEGQTFFVLTGRIKNIAKVRGESVSLEEMDRILCALPQVKDAACVAFPHHLLGEEIVAAIVLKEDVSDNEVRAQLRKTFSSTALPERIVRLNAIPRTTTGKIRRAQLSDEVNAALRSPASLRQ